MSRSDPKMLVHSAEAGELAKVVEAYRRAVQTAEIERRLSALEAQGRGQ